MPLTQRSLCPSSHALVIATSSRAPGAALTKAAKALECVSSPTSRREPIWRPAHSSSATTGSIVVDHSPSSSCTSRPGRGASTP